MATENKSLASERENALLHGGLRGRMAGAFCTLQSSVDALQRYLANSATPDVYDTARAMLEEMTDRIAALERLSGNAAELACGVLTRGAEELSPLELTGYLDETAACVNEELAIRGFGARLIVEKTAEPLWVMATTGLVDGIVVNLLSNLLQAQPGSKMYLTPGPGRTLLYRDEGPGLQKETAVALLEQGKPPLRLRDNGSIGLLLVREYAQAMGWTVQVEPGEGLCIRFEFPDFEMPAARRALWDAAAENRTRTSLLASRLNRELDGVFGVCAGKAPEQE